jgi:hypothetical protein
MIIIIIIIIIINNNNIPFNVFCSFFEGGLMNSPPLKTFTTQVPQIPAPPQLPTIIAMTMMMYALLSADE